jgi:hypothetical protein
VTKTYDIDLKLPEDERWVEVIAGERPAARRLVRQFTRNASVPNWLTSAFSGMYKLSGGLYTGEIDAWAGALDVPPGLLTAAQCSYELSMAGGYFAGGLFGCTSAVVQHPSLGPTHIRYLDWELNGISEATRLFRFTSGSHQFVVVGIVGFVGALSGYIPGKYSVTINQAPASERPGFDLGAAFLVREVLTTCRTYDAAVYALTRTPIAAPVFFTVCGAKDGEGCVIERLRNEYAVRKLKRDGTPLVVTNHHVVDGWDELDCDDAGAEDSRERYEMASAALRHPRKTLRGLMGQLAEFPVYSSITVQRMVFNPRHGNALVVPE